VIDLSRLCGVINRLCRSSRNTVATGEVRTS
jgi:hypothetical protein